MKVIVDTGLCVGHARCEALAGDLYRTDPESGHVIPIDGEIAAQLEDRALRGARACPERAITVIQVAEAEEKILWPPR